MPRLPVKNEKDLQRAHQTIEEQAAKIRELEATLSKMDEGYYVTARTKLRAPEMQSSASQIECVSFQAQHVATLENQPRRNDVMRFKTQEQSTIVSDPSPTQRIHPFPLQLSPDQQRVLTREERLEAHRQRKRMENKYTEDSGKWENPPPPPNPSQGAIRIKGNDDLVQRLVADPVQRKMLDVIQKRVRKNTNRYSCEMDRFDMESNQSLISTGHISVESHSKVSANIDSTRPRPKRGKEKSRPKGGYGKSSNQTLSLPDKRRDALMQRLSMTLKDRRKLMKRQGDVPEVVKKSLRGHKLKKISWSMAQQFQNESESGDDGAEMAEGDFTATAGENVSDEIQCHTCHSMEDCEEDVDNPGIFYCATCWHSYESGMTSKKISHAASETILTKSTSKRDDSYPGRTDHDIQGKRILKAASSVGPMRESRIVMSRPLNEDTKQRNSNNCLWIMHDNQKLSRQIVCSGPMQMKCIVETRDPGRKNVFRMMLGVITYCGTRPQFNSFDNGERIDRGSACLCVSDIQGYLIDHDNVETKLSKDKQVYEFKLPIDGAIQLTGDTARYTMKKFLDGCTGPVDVILDPQCLPGHWYPQREAGGSMKRIAPQFRSKGVGYIRLGDDMGQNGLAFLSSDGCETFFSTLTKTIDPVQQNTLKRSLSLTNLKQAETATRSRAKSVGYLKSTSSEPSFVKSDCDSTDDRSQSYNSLDDETTDSSTEQDPDDDSSVDDDVGEVLKQLQNLELSKDAKWKDKTDLITKLGKIMKRNISSSRIHCSAVLNYLQDIIGAKNVNIHVLRVSLTAVGMTGRGMKSELASQIAWKTIMIEMLKLLKNKQVNSTVKDILRKMHSNNAFTLSNALPMIAHVLGMGKTGVRANNVTKTKKVVGTPGTSISSSSSDMLVQNPNNVDVIEWLAETTEVERNMEIIEPMLDRNGLSTLAQFCVSFFGHRDAACRKNASDGLLHTLVYGVQRLGIQFQECCSLCGQEILEMNHSKIWAQLVKAARMIIKEESKSNSHS